MHNAAFSTNDVVGSDPRLRGAHETARVHHAARGRGGRLAARGARAAANDAGDWVDQRFSPTPSRMATFRQGLNETGYFEGQSVAIEYRWAEGRYNLMPELVADLLRRGVTVIATPGSALAARAAKAATGTVPIVFAVGEDPVKLGLVASLAQPGGNLTGVNFLNTELVAKQLELLRQLVPATSRVAVLVNPANITAETTLRAVEPLPAPWA